MLSKIARRVASKWALAQAMQGFRPAIPQAYLKLAFAPSDPNFELIQEARDSINVFLPKFLDTLKKELGDTYGMNATEGHGKLVYFFSPRHPIDVFGLILSVRNERVYLDLSYMPYALNGSLDLSKAKHEKAITNPTMAGLAFMRIARSLIHRLRDTF